VLQEDLGGKGRQDKFNKKGGPMKPSLSSTRRNQRLGEKEKQKKKLEEGALKLDRKHTKSRNTSEEYLRGSRN